MTDFDPTVVTAHEHGRIRIYLASYGLSMEIGHVGTFERLESALGTTGLNSKDVQQIQTRILDEMPLSQFLIDAYDVSEDEIAPHRATLDAADGLILVIRSGAFRDRPVTLNTSSDATLLATLSEPNASKPFTSPLSAKGAEGILSKPAKKKPSDAAMLGRVATIALLVMALLVWVMIKIAG